MHRSIALLQRPIRKERLSVTNQQTQKNRSGLHIGMITSEESESISESEFQFQFQSEPEPKSDSKSEPISRSMVPTMVSKETGGLLDM
mmetsp:Transcript_26289/g.61778  ORF Transcript_26289/g.61778 Transcript_26289/m.61778 type:complete len:88 (-) Transcript_26289:176-439(-)